MTNNMNPNSHMVGWTGFHFEEETGYHLPAYTTINYQEFSNFHCLPTDFYSALNRDRLRDFVCERTESRLHQAPLTSSSHV
ncbi:hypothetical protein ZHAS_00012307 [Anopheles sinensis]|uniref:Uncharacterized protein n=1 Tax=Anopheles sinensis TaxID=74873 RepID=A0A084W2C2_ANOSI|nr:hypothetical protein ZHAS_00012307 [Anopheles sinensis]